MKRLYVIVPWLAGLLLLAVLLKPQFSSLQDMGRRRFVELAKPESEVLVGVCWPFSVNRDGMADGLALAQEEINAGHLAGNYRIRLVMRDDAYDERKGKRIAMEFADTPNMSAVIGYYDDAAGIDASPIFEASRLFHLIVGANSKQMTSYGFSYIARTVLSSDKIASQLAKFTIDKGYRRIAIIMEEDAFGEDLAYQYQSSLDQYDVEPVYIVSYTRELTDFTSTVNELKDVDADLIFFAGLEGAAIPFINKLRRIGLETPILGAFGDTPEMQAEVGDRLDKAMYFDFYNPESPAPENAAFVRKFYRRYGRMPETWAAQGYDALHILARALRSTGSRNPLDLSYAVRYMDEWQGASGRYKFDRSGNLEEKPIFIMKYDGRRPRLMQ